MHRRVRCHPHLCPSGTLELSVPDHLDFAALDVVRPSIGLVSWRIIQRIVEKTEAPRKLTLLGASPTLDIGRLRS